LVVWINSVTFTYHLKTKQYDSIIYFYFSFDWFWFKIYHSTLIHCFWIHCYGWLVPICINVYFYINTMLRTLYIVKASDKLTPETVKTFYLTTKLFDEVKWEAHKVIFHYEKVHVYGVPTDVKLSKIVDVETFFRFKCKF